MNLVSWLEPNAPSDAPSIHICTIGAAMIGQERAA